MSVIVCAAGLAGAGVLLTVVAATGPARLVVGGGLFGFSTVPSAALACVAWVVCVIVCVAAVLLSRRRGSAFAPAIGGTITLSVPIAIAVVAPGAVMQWSVGRALARDDAASPAATSTIVFVTVGAVVGAGMAIAASRYGRTRSPRAPQLRRTTVPGSASALRDQSASADTLSAASVGQDRPTRNIVMGGRPDIPDSALVHALKNAVTSIDETECEWVVDGIVAHLRMHTAMHYPTRPVGYQFQLSNGAYATVSDQAFGKRRALDFTGTRVVDGWWQPLTMLIWPKDLPEDGGWFTWSMDGKVGRRMRRDIANAVRLSYANRSWHRAEGFVLIDPLTAPEPLSDDAWPAS